MEKRTKRRRGSVSYTHLNKVVLSFCVAKEYLIELSGASCPCYCGRDAPFLFAAKRSLSYRKGW